VLQTYRSHPAQLARIRDTVRDLAVQAGLQRGRIEDLVLAISEAAANAIVHSGSGRLTVSWEVTDDRVVVEVRDEGVFRKRVPMPELDGVGGHGIPLMMALVDEVSVREGTAVAPGTVVRMVVGRGSQAATG